MPQRTRIHQTVAASMTAVSVLALSACSSTPPAAVPEFRGTLDTKVTEAKAMVPPSIVFRSGDTYASAFRSLGLLDGNHYIVEGDATQALPGNSTPIHSVDEVMSYFTAYGLKLGVTPMEGTKYVRVKVTKALNSGVAKASRKCPVVLSGSVPIGAAITAIADKAGLDVSYADSGATAYSGVVYPVGYKGSCAGALEYIARKADLSVSFTDTSVEFRMMDTAAVDIGLPLRDRRIALDILADGSIQQRSANGSSGVTGANPASTTNSISSSASGTNNGSKSLQSSFMTNYLASVRSILESTRTPFGSWHYAPETGQVFIRDRAEAVAAARSNLNRLAQAFYGRFEVTLTLYRMTTTKGLQVSGNIAHKINSELSLSFGNPAASVAGNTFGVAFDNTANGGNNRTKSVMQLLSQFGAVETLDTFALTLQAGIPQTLKVANNTEYIRNVSTTSTGTTGITTASIEQSNATDGAFVTMQARQAEVGKIAIDFGAFINRLDGFDTTQTASSVVKSQRGFERTFDTMAVVDDGVPYIASVVAQKSRNDATSTLPGAEGATGPLSYVIPAVAGSKSDASAQTYIIVMVEARKQ